MDLCEKARTKIVTSGDLLYEHKSTTVKQYCRCTIRGAQKVFIRKFRPYQKSSCTHTKIEINKYNFSCNPTLRRKNNNRFCQMIDLNDKEKVIMTIYYDRGPLNLIISFQGIHYTMFTLILDCLENGWLNISVEINWKLKIS